MAEDVPSPPALRPYTPPTLVTYGDVAVLTQGRSKVGARPDGASKNLRTN